MALGTSSRVWRSQATSTSLPAASFTIPASLTMRSCSHSPAVLLNRSLSKPRDLALGMAIGVDVEVDLEGGEAPDEDVVDHPPDLVEVHAGLDLAVGIDADLVAELAAQQFVDRDLERLALEVPQRDLDAGEGGDQRAGEAAFEDEAPPQLLEDRVDGERVAADQPRRELAG